MGLDGGVNELDVMDHCWLLLRGVSALHDRGLGLARISPGMAPSGMHWRLTIAPATNFDPGHDLGWHLRDGPAISWSSGSGPEYSGLVLTRRTTPDDVADHVLTLLAEDILRGADMTYIRWYACLLAECERLDRLPVAFSDSGPHGWQVGWGGNDFASPPPPIG